MRLGGKRTSDSRCRYLASLASPDSPAKAQPARAALAAQLRGRHRPGGHPRGLARRQPTQQESISWNEAVFGRRSDGRVMPKGLSRRASRTSAAHPCKHENSATQRIRRREPGSLGSCNPVKVTLPELLIEGVILLTQAGELDLHICAVTCGGNVISMNAGCRRRCVGSLTSHPITRR